MSEVRTLLEEELTQRISDLKNNVEGSEEDAAKVDEVVKLAGCLRDYEEKDESKVHRRIETVTNIVKTAAYIGVPVGIYILSLVFEQRGINSSSAGKDAFKRCSSFLDRLGR